MCEFCTKHGEGKKWYLNVKNYNNELLAEIDRKKFIEGFFSWTDTNFKKYFKIIRNLPLNVPIVGDMIRGVIKNMYISRHWGQVIPIEDVEKILSMTNSITRIPCICRKVSTGREVRSCFLISMDPSAIGLADMVDRSFFGGPDVSKFEILTKDKALSLTKSFEDMGQCHSVWTFKSPFIGAICNCGNTGCIPMFMYKKAAPIFFKSEYYLHLDLNKCIGCENCVKICPFHALILDLASKKVRIDRNKCYGCGTCRTVCGAGALMLSESR